MKMSKTILPALAMLIVSAVMLSTASFAWFAIGSQVTVNGMTVGVKSDSAFLVIGTSADITEQSYNTIAVSLNTSADLIPVALDTNRLATNHVAAASDPGSWYYQIGKENGSSEAVDSTHHPLDIGEGENDKKFGDYVAKYTVWVAVASKTQVKMSNLKATVTLGGTGGNEAVSVLVVGPDAYENLTNGASGTNTTLAGNVAIDNEIDNTPVPIDIYIYYFGGHESIHNDNLFAGSIKDATVTVSFSAGAEN